MVPVGLTDHPRVRGLGITRPAMDDYLVVLLHDPQTYVACVRGRDDVTDVPHDVVIEKMRRMAALLREQGVSRRSRKAVPRTLPGDRGLSRVASAVGRHHPAQRPRRFTR